MFGGPRKPLSEMTNREIVSSIVAFAVIGGSIIIACIVSAVRHGGTVFFVWNGIGVLFVTTILARSIPQAVAELRRRRESGPDMESMVRQIIFCWGGRAERQGVRPSERDLLIYRPRARASPCVTNVDLLQD